MKTIYIFLILFFMSGCSTGKNAFSVFDMNEHQELSAQSFKRVKLVDGDNVLGTFSSIYLNEVYPDRYNKSEYFIVYIYLKDSSKTYEIRLNSNKNIKIKELNRDNRFSDLIREKSKWSRYYLISFEEVEGDTLDLELYIDNSNLANVSYNKNKQ